MIPANPFAQPQTPQITKRKRLLFGLVYALILATLSLAAGELLVRTRGIKPWEQRELPIVSPGGRCFTKHPTLGYSHIPGAFTVTLRDGYSFKVTHLPNTLRITHPLATYEGARSKPEVWIFDALSRTVGRLTTRRRIPGYCSRDFLSTKLSTMA